MDSILKNHQNQMQKGQILDEPGRSIKFGQVAHHRIDWHEEASRLAKTSIPRIVSSAEKLVPI